MLIQGVSYEHGKDLLLCQYLLSNRLKQHSEDCLKEIALTLYVFQCCDESYNALAVGGTLGHPDAFSRRAQHLHCSSKSAGATGISTSANKAARPAPTSDPLVLTHARVTPNLRYGHSQGPLLPCKLR